MHRQPIARKWTFAAKRRVGRPGLMKKIATLIVRMVTENAGWGYCRIQGELKELGHRVAATTVKNVLKANGIKPAPERPTSWRTFLKAHWSEIGATDFFKTEVWTPLGLKTYYVLFLIDLKSRRVHHFLIASFWGVEKRRFSSWTGRVLAKVPGKILLYRFGIDGN